MLKAEGILAHAEIDAMACEDLVAEWDEFIAYREAQEAAMKARMRKP